MRYILSIMCLILAYSFSSGQENEVSGILSAIIEQMAEDERDDEALDVYSEQLYDLTERPVRINSADEDELSRLFFLTDFQVKSLFDYIHSSGSIYSIFEIASVPGFSRELASQISPFIILEPDIQILPKDIKRIRNTIIANLTVKYPASGNRYQGPPWKALLRYKFTAGSFSGGITSEKDAGEIILSGTPPLPDFFSGFLAWNGKGIVRKIILGDFGGRFGSGICLNTGLRTGLSLTQAGYLSGTDELRPYSSTDENIFFRGAASQLQIKNTRISLFCSANRVDASTDTTENASGASIINFRRSGVHNTLSSLEQKDNVSEYSYGVDIMNDFRFMRVGILLTGNRFSIPVKKTGTDPVDFFRFEGREINTVSIYHKAVAGRFVIFGELSSNLNGKSAIAQGFSFRPSDRLSMNIFLSSYEPGFTSLHGKGLFSTSGGDNSKGIFGNFTFEAAKHLFVSAGCDIRNNPWLKYRCDAPSFSLARELRVKYVPSERLSLEIICSSKSSEINDERDPGIRKQVTTFNRSAKWIIRYSPSDALKLLTRMDLKTSCPSKEKGSLLLQDISYRFDRINLSIWFRYCIFRTGGWSSRIYAYENDLLYSFSIPGLSGEGSRSCLMVDYDPWEKLGLRLKFGLTEHTAGSDNPGCSEEIRFQIRMRF